MDDDRNPTAVSVVLGVLYVLAVGIQLYVVADELTHGALSEQVTGQWRRATARWAARRRLDRQVREAAPHVLWEAYQVLEEEA